MTLPQPFTVGESQKAEPLGVKLARALVRSRVRGTTRVLLMLARLAPPLQVIALKVHKSQTIFLDLRVPSAHSLLVNPAFEPEIEAVFRRFVREGDFAIDVGAHVGYHTALLSTLVGDTGIVMAIEPNPALLPNLKRTADKLGNVDLMATALSSVSKSHTLYVPEDASMASLANWTGGRHGIVKTVPCHSTTLDKCLENLVGLTPALIKCDVEGAEIDVFKGAKRTLNREDAPVILFEANHATYRAFSHTLTEAIEVLQSFHDAGYTVYRIGTKGDLICASKRSDEPHQMLVAVPKLRQRILD